MINKIEHTKHQTKDQDLLNLFNLKSMKNIENQLELIAELESQLVKAKEVLDGFIHIRFLKANSYKEDSKFSYGEKTIVRTFVKNGTIKGVYLKKNGEEAKTSSVIKVNSKYEII